MRFRAYFFLAASIMLYGATRLAYADVPAGPAISTAAPMAIPLEDVSMQSDSAFASLSAIDSDLASEQAIASVKKDLPIISREINARLEETSKLLAASPSLDRLERLETGWNDYEHTFDEWQKDITRRASELEKHKAVLTQLDETWALTLKSAQRPDTPAPVLENIQRVAAALGETRNHLEKKRRENLILQEDLAGENARVDREVDAVSRASKEAVDHLFSRDSAPVWKDMNRDPAAPSVAEEGSNSLRTQIRGLRAYAERQAHKFFIHVIVLLFLVLGLYWMRGRLQPMAGSAHPATMGAFKVLEVPVACAVVLSLLASLWLYPQAPRLLWAIWGAAALIPTVLIVRRLIAAPMVPILNALVVFYAVDQIREVVAVLPLVSRLLFIAEMLGGILFMAWRIRTYRKSVQTETDAVSRVLGIAVRAAFILFLAAFLSEVFGDINLATLIGNAVLGSADLAVIFYALVCILEALAAFLFNVGPVSRLRVIQRHQDILRRRIRMVLVLGAWVFWALYTLGLLSLRAAFFDAAGKILNYELTLGSLSMTLGHLLSFGVTIWAAFLVSRLIRFILEEDVYTRFHLGSGLPYAISTLLNYVILTIGFFLAIAALGIDMTKFTILAGAFGVGVGFGTQNIINNFVSGLILLFERPIKVGDVIQVDDATGVVERIGIRATVIRTTSGSEVVLPNGSLISGRVTNWTNVSGQRSIDMPVSVAAGSDPKQVMDLLKSVAAADPRIAKDPAPQAFFVKYSPGSLDFQLRAWTDRVDQIIQIQSDLALALNAALFKENLALK